MSTNKDLDGAPLGFAENDTAERRAEAAEPHITGDVALTDEELVALCRDRVCSACNEKEQADADRLRALAEMDNFKKRLAREQEEFRRYAAENVLADLLPVLDNLALALEHARTNEACKDIVMGVEMTRKIFLDTLRTHGLTAVGEPGEPFNPEIHEAMGREEGGGPDTVRRVLQSGYKLGDRLLRPAKVMVGR
ncbi:MAG: nucleotide exchange factor GrpE [Desulfovibrionaceae bacterium]|jgi:molecular chaperone GrpE|nr:nucleotide exchange factor GrpE [Desulfovibrionaceae bacterium]